LTVFFNLFYLKRILPIIQLNLRPFW